MPSHLLAILAFISLLVQPAQGGAWLTNAPMISPLAGHTATLLTDGRVLMAGGRTSNVAITNGVELYDPNMGAWTATGAMSTSREFHSAILLPNGKVLVAGGTVDGDVASIVASSELYNPLNGNWMSNAPMNNTRADFTMTLLSNGKVLVTGGLCTGGSVTNSAELYDPMAGTWTLTGAMSQPRYSHATTLLPDGRVLVTGGTPAASPFHGTTTAEIYDPVNGQWTNTASMTNARVGHVAMLLPNGKVLEASGAGSTNTELFDPVSQTWTTTGTMTTLRNNASANLLPNGTVLVSGGSGNSGPLASAELYDWVAGTWSNAAPMNYGHWFHAAVGLASGRILVSGGYINNSSVSNNVEVYDPTSNPATGTWTTNSIMVTARYGHTATLLPNGKVLLAAGNGNFGNLSSAELYDPTTGTNAATGSLTNAPDNFRANLLPNGKVLVTGGIDNSGGPPKFLSSVQLYDSTTGTWTGASPMHTPREVHSATLLRNGKLLVAGGATTNAILAAAELYDPASDTWTITGSMSTPRAVFTATLLMNGKVLVAGGDTLTSGNSTNSAELFDPATGQWALTGNLVNARSEHTATLLANGQVLVVGGYYTGSHVPMTNAELYNPTTGTWSLTGSPNYWRFYHAAALLPNGKVIVVGGMNNTSLNPFASAELYDPATGTWATTGMMNYARAFTTATLLPNGKLFVAGGEDAFGRPIATNELYDAGLGFSNSWQPQIGTITSPIHLGSNVSVTGSQFRGVSEGVDGSSADSATDYPLVQLRNLENEETIFLSATNWSTNSFASATVTNFPPGYALATVFVNGIPGTSSIVNVSAPVSVPTVLTGLKKLSNGAIQFSFTNNVGTIFGVQTSTNIALPATNWTLLGGVTEISPGQFQFTDTQASNSPQKFYRLRAP